MRIYKSALILTIGLCGISATGVCAESSSNEPTTPITMPATGLASPSAKPPVTSGAGPRPMSSMMMPQPSLTPEENKILSQARVELQKDPEIQELTTQIKALMEKRSKLTDEKLSKISPEAAAIVQKVKDHQEKMQAERRAQMETMQAQHKLQQETKKSQVLSDKSEPAPTPTSTPAPTP